MLLNKYSEIISNLELQAQPVEIQITEEAPLEIAPPETAQQMIIRADNFNCYPLISLLGIKQDLTWKETGIKIFFAALPSYATARSIYSLLMMLANNGILNFGFAILIGIPSFIIAQRSIGFNLIAAKTLKHTVDELFYLANASQKHMAAECVFLDKKLKSMVCQSRYRENPVSNIDIKLYHRWQWFEKIFSIKGLTRKEKFFQIVFSLSTAYMMAADTITITSEVSPDTNKVLMKVVGGIVGSIGFFASQKGLGTSIRNSDKLGTLVESLKTDIEKYEKHFNQVATKLKQKVENVQNYAAIEVVSPVPVI